MEKPKLLCKSILEEKKNNQKLNEKIKSTNKNPAVNQK